MKYSAILASAVTLASSILVAAAPTSPLSVSLPMEKTHLRRHGAAEEIIGDLMERTPCGRIFVQSSGSYSGYVQGTRDDSGRYFVSPDLDSALKVKFQDQTIILDHEFQNGFPRLGATFGLVVDSAVGQDNMAGNSFNYAYISATGELHKAGDPATTDSSSFNTAFGTNQHVGASQSLPVGVKISVSPLYRVCHFYARRQWRDSRELDQYERTDIAGSVCDELEPPARHLCQLGSVQCKVWR